jgi:DNA-binding transcriptional MerR regulator
MIKESIEQLLKRDIKKLQQEIAAYEDEAQMWKTVEGISNSAGNLCLHLIGNLNTYIGATLGGTDYVRQRELEFSSKDIPRYLMIENIDKVLVIIDETFEKISDEQLQEIYPSEVLGYPMTTLYFLIHLQAHLNYHLGQINYHRRILSNK